MLYGQGGSRGLDQMELVVYNSSGAELVAGDVVCVRPSESDWAELPGNDQIGLLSVEYYTATDVEPMMVGVVTTGNAAGKQVKVKFTGVMDAKFNSSTAASGGSTVAVGEPLAASNLDGCFELAARASQYVAFALEAATAHATNVYTTATCPKIKVLMVQIGVHGTAQ